MKKLFGSNWMRFILVLVAYVCYIPLIGCAVRNSGAMSSSNFDFGVWDFIFWAIFVMAIICGWKAVRNINTSAGAFMVVIKVLCAVIAGFWVAPFVIGSIPYKICHRNDIAEE